MMPAKSKTLTSIIPLRFTVTDRQPSAASFACWSGTENISAKPAALPSCARAAAFRGVYRRDGLGIAG